MKKGMTVLELLISIAVLAVIALISVVFLYQTLTSRDQVLTLSLVDEAGQNIMERISGSIRKASSLSVKQSGTVLEANSDKCEVYSLQGSAIYYDEGDVGGLCPTPSENTRVSGTQVQITNAQNPVITLFTGSPTDNAATNITIKLRVKALKPFVVNEITLQQTIARRR
jgi:prepilin-type N-terminal cleavage/methylation domain-containing protein